MKPPPFRLLRAGSLDEATDGLARFGEEAKVLAGGQSLVPLLNFRLARPAILVDLDRVSGLDSVDVVADELVIGAMARQAAVERHPVVRSRLPLLAEALRHVGHVQVRNRGTVGGSVAHADPAAELPAVCVALGARVEVAQAEGTRTIGAEDLFRGPFMTALGPTDVLTAIRFPISDIDGWAFQELARRHGDFAIAGVVVVRHGTGHRLVAFGMGWAPVRLMDAEAALSAGGADALIAAASAASAEVEPMGDIHADADYRRDAIRVLVTRSLAGLAGRAA